jgi:hypothetical protein
MRTGFHLSSRFRKIASGAEKQNQAIVSEFFFEPYNTVYYHKNPYKAVSSGHKLGTVCFGHLEDHFRTRLKCRDIINFNAFSSFSVLVLHRLQKVCIVGQTKQGVQTSEK